MARSDHTPSLLISVHGIRTWGAWQKQLAPVFSKDVGAIEAFEYPGYNIGKFLRRRRNWKMVEEFYSWYGSIVRQSPQVDLQDFRKRPSCIAHSFGSWIVGMALQMHEDIRLEKLILSGSVLPTDFDWDLLISRDQVDFVYNECGGRDIWPELAGRVLPEMGSAGRKGFDSRSALVVNHRHPHFSHSTALIRQHMQEKWRPLLLTAPSPLNVVHGRNISSEQRFSKILGELRMIDRTIFGSDPQFPALSLAAGLSLTWTAVNPDIYTLLIDRVSEKAVGYINAMPVTDEAYARLRAGEITNKDVLPDDVVEFSETQREVKLYLMSVAILPAYRIWGQGLGHQGYVKLFAALMHKFIYYAEEEGVVVTHILSVTWTPEGNKISEQLGMRKIDVDRHGHSIYELDLAPFVAGHRPVMNRRLRAVANLYRARTRPWFRR